MTKIVWLVKYLGPALFLVGLAYTTFYPERKLLANSKSRNGNDKTIPVGNTHTTDANSAANDEEIPISKCRVRFFFSKSISYLYTY